MNRILILEDDRDIAELVRYNLERDGFQVIAQADGLEGFTQFRKSPPDLLILDLMLPGLSGLDICKRIRRDPSFDRLPILMLTARSEEADKVLGLEIGADDYMIKPFSVRELVARVRMLLRRTRAQESEQRPIEVKGLRIDPSSHRVLREGSDVSLSALEFRLLHFLASHPNRVFSRDQLLDAAWGTKHFVTPRSVDVYI